MIILSFRSRFALPNPPLVVDGNPSCRLCGAELPAGGALRECSYCRGHSLVIANKYQRSFDDLSDMLREFNLRLRQSTHERMARSDRFAQRYHQISAAISLWGLVAYWAVPTASHPAFWWITCLFGAACLTSFAVWRVWIRPPLKAVSIEYKRRRRGSR